MKYFRSEISKGTTIERIWVLLGLLLAFSKRFWFEKNFSSFKIQKIDSLEMRFYFAVRAGFGRNCLRYTQQTYVPFESAGQVLSTDQKSSGKSVTVAELFHFEWSDRPHPAVPDRPAS